MSKLIKFLIMILVIAVATPVMAEERLSLSGQMRVRGYHVDNQWNFDNNVNGASTYFNQRLRLNGRISVADGITVNFRTHVSNGRWGQDRNNVQFQRAFMIINQDKYNLRAGRMPYTIGNAIGVDLEGDGIVLTLKGKTPVEFGYFKIVESSPLNKDNDADLYTVAIKHKTKLYDGVVFGGFYRDATTPINGDNLTIYMGGAQSKFDLKNIKLNVELNYFNGDQGAIDYRGLQAYIDANTSISQRITIGTALFYAQGQTGDTVQVTDLVDNGNFMPESYGFMESGFNVLPGPANNATFDPTGNGTGVLGAQLYGQVILTKDLSVRGAVGYWSPEETDVKFKSFITATGSTRYKVAASTNLDTVIFYTIPETRNNAKDDNALGLAFRLAVNF